MTQCNNNIGIVVIPDLVGDSRDEFYKNMTAGTNSTTNQAQGQGIQQRWEWTDLQDIIDDYCEGNATSSVGGAYNSLDQ